MIRTLTAAALALFVVGSVHAHDFTAGPLVIAHPWSRATPKSATVAGGYLKITNTGNDARPPDRRLRPRSPASFEVHEMSMDGGVMKMRELTNGLEIPAGRDR